MTLQEAIYKIENSANKTVMVCEHITVLMIPTHKTKTMMHYKLMLINSDQSQETTILGDKGTNVWGDTLGIIPWVPSVYHLLSDKWEVVG